jgi:putative endonuclease
MKEPSIMSNESDHPYCVYILRCSDDTLYTGIALDVNKRLLEHNSSPKGAKYTHARRPVMLVYSENHEDKSSALKREIAIKKMSRLKKNILITQSSKTI